MKTQELLEKILYTLDNVSGRVPMEIYKNERGFYYQEEDDEDSYLVLTNIKYELNKIVFIFKNEISSQLLPNFIILKDLINILKKNFGKEIIIQNEHKYKYKVPNLNFVFELYWDLCMINNEFQWLIYKGNYNETI